MVGTLQQVRMILSATCTFKFSGNGQVSGNKADVIDKIKRDKF